MLMTTPAETLASDRVWTERFRDWASPRKLDCYVAQTFLGPFVLCVLAVIGLYIVIDFFSNINQFLAHDSLFESIRLTAMYYTLRIPSFLAQIMPILTAIPAVICLIRLEQSNELAAMRASGISARRAAAPLLLCAGAVAVVAALNQELLVPALRDPLAEVERLARQTGSKEAGFAHAFDRDGNLLLITTYNPEEPLPTLTDITRVWQQGERVVREQKAARAFAPRLGPTWYMERVREFQPGEHAMPRREKKWKPQPPESFTSERVRWLVEDYVRGGMTRDLLVTDESGARVAYTFGGYTRDNERWPVGHNVEILQPNEPERGRWFVRMMVWLEDRWIAFGAVHYGSIDPATGKVTERILEDGDRLPITIRPSDIRAGEIKRASATMTLAELVDVAERFPRQDFRRRCRVIIWNRLAFPLANIVLVLLALPLVFRRSSRAALPGVAIALVMILVFTATNFVSMDLGNRGWFLWEWPIFAGAFPVILFGLVAAWMFTGMDDV